jgi:hypothetical protein
MNCPKCGNEMKDGDVFCGKCGFNVEEKSEKDCFCRYCGSKMSSKEDVCPVCDQKVLKPALPTPPVTGVPMMDNVYAVIGLILAWFLPIPGFILGVLGLTNAKKCGGKGKGMSIIAIVISVVAYILPILLVILYYIFVVVFVLGMMLMMGAAGV